MRYENVPFHFETVDGSQTSSISLLRPLPAIWFELAIPFPSLTDVPRVSVAIADLAPALVPGGPASLLEPK